MNANDSTAPASSARLLRWALPWSIFLSLLLTWPTVMHFNSEVLGSPHADGLKHVWTVWWIRSHLLAGEIPFSTDLVNHPWGLDLYPIEPLNGILASLLGFLPLVATVNLLALLNLSLVGVCGAWMGWTLSKSRLGAFVAGTLLQGSSIALFTLHVGVGELQHLWWLPLGLTLWHRLREQPGLKRALALCGALVGATLSCFYHGFFLALGVALLSLFTLWAGDLRRTGRLLLSYALAAGLGLMIVLPITRAFATSYGGGEPPRVGLSRYVLESGHQQPVTDPPSSRLAPEQLLQPASPRRSSASVEELAYGGGRYLGWIACGLALAGLLLRPRETWPWVLVIGSGIALSLGSYFTRGGAELMNEAGMRYQMPFLYLNRGLGYVAEPLNFPARALALSSTGLAAMAALVSTQLRGRWSLLLLALPLLHVVEIQLAQLIPRPMPSFTLLDYSDIQEAAEDQGPFLDLALAWRSDQETRAVSLMAQVTHGEAIHGLPLERIEYFAQDGKYFAMALPMVQELEQSFYGDIPLQEAWRDDLALLWDRGYRSILLLGTGPRRELPRRCMALLERLLGPPLVQGAAGVIYPLREPDLSEEELEALRQLHQGRIQQLQGDLQLQLNPQIH